MTPTLQPIIDIAIGDDRARIKLSKASTQKLVATVASYASGIARRLEEGRLAADPVATAKDVTSACEAVDAIIEAASEELSAIEAALSVLRGDPTDYRSIAHPVMALAVNIAQTATELRQLDPEASAADLSEVIDALHTTQSQLRVDLVTARKRFTTALHETRRTNGAALAALSTAAQRQAFGDAGLDALLPETWPAIRGEITTAHVDAAKTRVADSLSARRLQAHKERNERRRKQTSDRLDQLDQQEAQRMKANADAVRQVEEIVNG